MTIEEQPVTPISRDDSPPGARGNILVVDDDPACLKALSQIFTSDGFSVRVAPDGEAALRCIEDEPPDAVVTDVEMPKMDGLTLLWKVRSLFPQVTVVVMSGHHRGAASILQGGAIAFVQKPFHVDEVVSVIDAALQLKHEERAHRGLVEASGAVRSVQVFPSMPAFFAPSPRATLHGDL